MHDLPPQLQALFDAWRNSRTWQDTHDAWETYKAAKLQHDQEATNG